MADILVVDDDKSIATAFEHFLSYEGHQFRLASSAADGLAAVAVRRPDLVVMDVRMPGTDGLTALQQMRERVPDLPVVIMTAYGSSQTSIDAIRLGAFDYLTKPLDLETVRDVIARVTVEPHLADGEESAPAMPEPALVGSSASMLGLYKLIGRLATNDVAALLTGEAGTGRHLVARSIHTNSARRDQALLHLACASAMEAEVVSALGNASIGTLHLADVDHLSPALQARVLAGLRDAAVGTPGARPRLLASMTMSVDEAGRAGRPGKDLLDALSVVTLQLPPLRDRREDIPELVHHFIGRANAELGRAFKAVDEPALVRLRQYPWPGNVAELERAIRRACILGRGPMITLAELGESLERTSPSSVDAEPGLQHAVRVALHDRLVKGLEASAYHAITTLVESTLVDEALAITNGNQLKASSLLGLNRTTLRKKMPGA